MRPNTLSYPKDILPKDINVCICLYLFVFRIPSHLLLRIHSNQMLQISNLTLFPKLRKVYRYLIHLDAGKRKNDGESPPNKKQKTKKKPEFVTVPLKQLFSKDSPGKGRPALSDDVMDVLADLQTKNHARIDRQKDTFLTSNSSWTRTPTSDW